MVLQSAPSHLGQDVPRGSEVTRSQRCCQEQSKEVLLNSRKRPDVMKPETPHVYTISICMNIFHHFLVSVIRLTIVSTGGTSGQEVLLQISFYFP